VSSPDRLLAVRDLRVAFRGDEARTLAVDGVDLDLAAGEVLGLVGESGCGKSTVALALLGLLPGAARVLAGHARFADRDLLACSEGRLRKIRGKRIAMVFQDPMTSLNPYLRIGIQLTEHLRRHLGLDRAAARHRAIGLLARVGIPDPATRFARFPHEFSGGQRQRISIAIALACDPEVLIADEPTTALDVTIQAQILDLLRELQRERGMAMILVSHDLGVIAGSCDRVAVMYAGRIVEEAPTRELYATPLHPYTRSLLASIPRLEGTRGVELTTIPGLPPRLEHGWQGCAFTPRCPEAEPRCASLDCPVFAHSAQHRHRCAKLAADREQEAT